MTRMFNWKEFKEEVVSRIGIDSINPNPELKKLHENVTLDGVVDLQNLIPALRNHHVTSYSPATGVRTEPGVTEFNLPQGVRAVDGLYYRETVLDTDCVEWYSGFVIDGFDALKEAEGYYNRTGVSDPLEGIERYSFGPVWYVNTDVNIYGFRILRRDDGMDYPALFELGGDDPLENVEDPIPIRKLYYLTNPIREPGEDGPAYAPWRSDGPAVWKSLVDESIIDFPDPVVAKSFIRGSAMMQYVPWEEFVNGSPLYTWSSPRPGIDPFYVRGPHRSRHDRIDLHWSGIKQSYEDDDPTQFDTQCARAVAYLLKKELLAGHKDRRLLAREYENSFKEERRTLYLAHKKVSDDLMS